MLDHCVPAKFAQSILDHEVVRSSVLGLADLSNGALVKKAAELGFGAIITIDKNMRFQQSVESDSVALIVLDRTDSRLPSLLELVPELLGILSSVKPGEVHVICEP